MLNLQKPTLRGLIPDNGLALLASCLIEQGRNVRIIDYCTVDSVKTLSGSKDASDFVVSDAVEKISRSDAKYTGVKLWMNGFENTIASVKKMRDISGGDLTFIGGGPQVDYFWEYFDDLGLFSESGGPFDAFVVNEGEKSLPLILSSKDWKSIPNLIYKKNGRVIPPATERIQDLDSLPVPNYSPDVYPAMLGDEKLKFINMRINWGCPYGKCNFCFHPVKSGKKFKEKAAKRTVDEIKYYIENYHTTAFRFGASSASALINDIAREIINSGLKITYSMFGNANLGDKYDFKLLKRSGCESIFYGAESGNQAELDWMNKGVKVGQIERVVKATEDAGIHAMLSFIYLGDRKGKDDTVNLIMKTRPSAISIFPLTVMPRTPLACDLPSTIQLSGSYFHDYMTLKVNLTKPKNEWLNLKYTINGKSASQLLAETMQIEAELEQQGIPSRITDETFVIAKYTGMSPIEVRDFERKIEVFSDYPAVREFVYKFNQSSREYTG